MGLSPAVVQAKLQVSTLGAICGIHCSECRRMCLCSSDVVFQFLFGPVANLDATMFTNEVISLLGKPGRNLRFNLRNWALHVRDLRQHIPQRAVLDGGPTTVGDEPARTWLKSKTGFPSTWQTVCALSPGVIRASVSNVQGHSCCRVPRRYGQSRQGTRTACIGKIAGQFGDSIEMMLCDMSDLDNIQKLHAEYTAKFDRLDILFNNAGAMWGKRQITAQGHEMTFGVNHLGYFEMTRHFLPLLKATQGSRIINTASVAHRMAHLRLDNLNHENKWYSQWRTYGNSKAVQYFVHPRIGTTFGRYRHHHPLLPPRCSSNSIWFECKWYCVVVLAYLPCTDD